MPTLAKVMKESLEKANAHTRTVFGTKPMTTRQVTDLVRRQVSVMLATVKLSGRPHVSLTGMVVLRGRLYLGQSERFAALRNIRRNPQIGIVISGGGWKRHVLMEATAKELAQGDPRTKAIAEEETRRFGWSYDVHLEVTPTKVFTWAGE